ncbi:MAG: outer membrane lipoprotein carrier protein LolA [Bacteroidales bacterium]|jgi:outer membrane lipoprotein-sorting protein|nr:outer membrane lipoprotein carrier protein LolA [Bacteroidales bacterium]
MKSLFAIILTAFVFSFSSFSQREVKNGVVIDHNAEKIVKNISKKLKDDAPLSFDFVFSAKEGDKVSQTEKGSFLSNGDKFRVISTSFEDYSDGKSVWHYLKTANEVEVSSVDEQGSMFNFSNMISTYLKDFRPKLIKEQTKANVVYNVIDLTAVGKSFVIKVRLLAAKNTNRISEMTLYTQDDRVYTYTLSNYKAKLKTSLSDFTFQTDKYPKVQVVDLR